MARVIRADGAVVVPHARARAHADARRILDDARQEIEATTARLRDQERARATAELAAEHLRIAAQVEAEVARLVPEIAVAVAEKILNEELSTRPQRIAALVSNALARVPRAKRVRVMVHPDDLSALTALGIDAEGVEDLARGDVVVQSELGQIDARLSVQLEAFRAALTRTKR